MLGAEEYGFGTAALVAIGCDMARQCHLDTCPTGIATQREDLRAKFTGTPEQVVAFFTALAEDVRRELAALGLRSLGEAVGRADLLDGTAAAAIDLGRLVSAPAWAPASEDPPKDRPLWADRPADDCFEADALDGIVNRVAEGETLVRAHVTTRDRSIGARLAGALQRRPEPRRLPHVRYELTGSAGQSLGAFAVAGMRIQLIGEANDYVGKGLSGATIVVRPPDGAGAGPGAGRQRVPLRRHRRRPPPGRPRRNALRRPQLRRAGGGRGRRRARLRVHDRRHGGGARVRSVPTSAPA